MLAADERAVSAAAEMLGVALQKLTDCNGMLVAFPVDQKRYVAAIMAALVSLTDGEAIGYQGHVHMNLKTGQQFELVDPNAK